MLHVQAITFGRIYLCHIFDYLFIKKVIKPLLNVDVDLN